jgi:4-carboxymuconolactone decarboxylase
MEDDSENQAGDATLAYGGSGRRTIERLAEPRLPLMEVSALSPDQRALAAIGASNVLRMLARREDLLAGGRAFGTSLTSKARVPMRTRELLVLRVRHPLRMRV